MYNIKEVAEKLNINANAIRFYEKKGLLKPVRDENDYRLFTPEDVGTLQMILLYRQMGFSVEAITEILKGDTGTSILDKFVKQYQALNAHIHAMTRIRETLSTCVEQMLNSTTLDQTMVEAMALTAQQIAVANQWQDHWHFDDWAEQYDQDIRRQGVGLDFYANYDEVLLKTAAHVETGRVVEIGIGTGNLARIILDSKGSEVSYLGIDQSLNMLKQAKRKCPEAEVRMGTFLKLPVGDRSADAVVTSYAFHHCNEVERVLALSEMSRILKPGGKIVITDLMFANQESRIAFEKSCTPKVKYELNDEFFANVDEVVQLLESNGFKCVAKQIDPLIWSIIAQ